MGWELILLILSIAAIVRAILGAAPVFAGDATAMGLVTEVWFSVVGILGMALWVTLQGCRQQLKRQDQGGELPWDLSKEKTISYAEFKRRWWGKKR